MGLLATSVGPFITQQQETTAEGLAGRGHNTLLGVTDVVQLQAAAVLTHVHAHDQNLQTEHGSGYSLHCV